MDEDGHDDADSIGDFDIYSWQCGCGAGSGEKAGLRQGRAQMDALAHRDRRADHHVSVYVDGQVGRRL